MVCIVMRKIINKNICFMGILITLLELAVFLSTPYSKSILPVYPLNNLIWSIVLFTVFFFSFSAFVIFGFAKKTFLLYKKQIVISFFALLFIRVILDIGCYIFKSTEIKSIYSLLTDCVFFVIIFQIITFAYTGRNLLKDIYGKIKGKEKSIVVILLFYVLVVAIVVSYLVYIFINLQMYAEKYTIDSSFYLFKSMNYNFNSQLLRMFTAIILQILLVIILNNLYANNFDADLYWSKIFLNIIARTIVAFIAIFVLLFIKICISNVGTIAKTPERSSDCYIGLPNLISNSFVYKQIYRVKGNSSQILSYENTDVKIKYHDEELLDFKLNNFFDYEYINKEQNNINNSNSGVSIKIQDQEVVFFSNQYIAYAKNDTPYVIAFDDIKNQNENEVITNFLEYMITCGYWDYFEYGCDYLKKYDSDFIKPYIERYANGNFTEDEINENREINTEYMTNFAQKMLEIK